MRARYHKTKNLVTAARVIHNIKYNSTDRAGVNRTCRSTRCYFFIEPKGHTHIILYIRKRTDGRAATRWQFGPIKRCWPSVVVVVVRLQFFFLYSKRRVMFCFVFYSFVLSPRHAIRVFISRAKESWLAGRGEGGCGMIIYYMYERTAVFLTRWNFGTILMIPVGCIYYRRQIG